MGKEQTYPHNCVKTIPKGMGEVMLMECFGERINHQVLAKDFFDIKVLDLMIKFPVKVVLHPDLFWLKEDNQVRVKDYSNVLLCKSQFVIDAPKEQEDMKFQYYPTYTVDKENVVHAYELPDGVQAVCGVEGVDAMRKHFYGITTSVGVSHIPVLYPKNKESVLHHDLDVQYDRLGFRSDRLYQMMHMKVPMPKVILWNEIRMLQEYVWSLVYNGSYGDGFQDSEERLYQSWHELMPQIV